MSFDHQQFRQDLAVRKEFVDHHLSLHMKDVDAFPPVIHEAMHYAVFNGGKRIRPILVYEGAGLAGGSRDQVIPTACALELIHSYSLVHDDLPAMDDDDLRRGKPTCHKVYGEANAILTGDALLTRAFELLAGNASIQGIDAMNVLQVIDEVAQAAGSRGMIGGQVIDLAYEGQNVDYADLQTMHSLKTGELFRASLRAGAILCGMDKMGIKALDIYAANFGLAFQITDDILNVKGNEELLGKPVGSDDKKNKTTYPRLFGLTGAEKLAKDSIEVCLECLSGFGSRAGFLKQLALYLLERDS